MTSYWLRCEATFMHSWRLTCSRFAPLEKLFSDGVLRHGAELIEDCQNSRASILRFCGFCRCSHQQRCKISGKIN